MPGCEIHWYWGPTECPECQKEKNSYYSDLAEAMAVRAGFAPALSVRVMNIINSTIRRPGDKHLKWVEIKTELNPLYVGLGPVR